VTAPVLVLAVGNPSRGDDAVGPRFAEHLERTMAEQIQAGQLEVLTDFQLNVEHALDLVDRRRVVFVDASARASPPFTFEPVAATADPSFTTHALSPGAVLEAWSRVLATPPPPCFVLAVAGRSFELGEPLTPEAERNLGAAQDFFASWWRESG